MEREIDRQTDRDGGKKKEERRTHGHLLVRQDTNGFLVKLYPWSYSLID